MKIAQIISCYNKNVNITNHNQSDLKLQNNIAFSGKTHKSVDRFYKSIKGPNDKMDLLNNIKQCVSKLHKDTVLRVYKHTDIYLPLRDSYTTYLLYATNKNFKDDKYVIGTIGSRDGLIGRRCYFEDSEEDITRTLPHIDKIFVQHAKNSILLKDQNSPNVIEMKNHIDTFAKSANINPNEEINLDKYPMYSYYYM
jgi:hypothetical protein